jgi:hypothetical protein
MINLGLFYDCWLQSLKVSQPLKFLLGGAVNPTPNPQPGGPGYSFLSGSSPLTCPALETLPAATLRPAYLRIVWPDKPHHYVKVVIPTGGGVWKTLVHYLVTDSNVPYVVYNFNIRWLFFMKHGTKIMHVEVLCIAYISLCLQRLLMAFYLGFKKCMVNPYFQQ